MNTVPVFKNKYINVNTFWSWITFFCWMYALFVVSIWCFSCKCRLRWPISKSKEFYCLAVVGVAEDEYGVLLERSLHAVQRAFWIGRGSGLACVCSQVDTAIDSIVVLVGRRRWNGPQHLAWRLLAIFHICIINEGYVMDVIVDQKFRGCHEIVNGGLGVGFL